MGDPIKPSNEVVLGGVRFDANDAENYGRKFVATDKEFFINFKNGTKVEFNQQPQTQQSGIYQPGGIGKSIFDEQDTSRQPVISDLSASNVTDLSVSTARAYGAYGCKDIEIEGNGYVHVSNSENVSIRTGDGDDDIYIYNSNHFTVDSGDGKDDVVVKQESSYLSDSRYIPLPEGEVILSPEDKLKIMKEAHSSDYSKRSDEALRDDAETYQVTTTTMSSVANVKGEGTHQIKQTPEEAFDTKKVVIVEEHTLGGDCSTREISTKIEDVD